MGSDYYMNPPKWTPPKFKSWWTGRQYTITKFPGYYDAPLPNMKWEIVFDEEISAREEILVNRVLTALGHKPIDNG